MTSKKFVVVEWVNNAEDRREFTVLRGSDIIPKTGEVLRQGCVVSVVYREKAADTPRLYDAEVLQIFDSQRKAKQFENELLERGNDSDQETPRPKKRKPCQKVVEAASLNDETSGGKHANKRPKSNKSKSGDVRTPKPKVNKDVPVEDQPSPVSQQKQKIKYLLKPLEGVKRLLSDLFTEEELMRCTLKGKGRSRDVLDSNKLQMIYGAMRGNYGMTDEKVDQLIRNQQKSLKEKTKKVFSTAK
ncbi:uncharacterized protein LOC125559932 isoform X2 [Nematostella vectensis]|uniref:uncharacterized protein LOC125559932 isoform X2 n=1 Tax=Nematostella vectensis TaxID=45351 RepID=UPI00207798D6|nr:uncharacterized protein LOC125559932 isoform X2 [Nematostella vectensis]